MWTPLSGRLGASLHWVQILLLQTRTHAGVIPQLLSWLQEPLPPAWTVRLLLIFSLPPTGLLFFFGSSRFVRLSCNWPFYQSLEAGHCLVRGSHACYSVSVSVCEIERGRESMCSVRYLGPAQLSKFKVSQVRRQNCSHSKIQLS